MLVRNRTRTYSASHACVYNRNSHAIYRGAPLDVSDPSTSPVTQQWRSQAHEYCPRSSHVQAAVAVLRTPDHSRIHMWPQVVLHCYTWSKYNAAAPTPIIGDDRSPSFLNLLQATEATAMTPPASLENGRTAAAVLSRHRRV